MLLLYTEYRQVYRHKHFIGTCTHWPESSTVKPNTTQYCQKSRNNFNSRVFGSLITGSRRINCKKKKRHCMLQIFNTRNSTRCIFRFFMGVCTKEEIRILPLWWLESTLPDSLLSLRPVTYKTDKKNPTKHTKQNAFQSYHPNAKNSFHDKAKLK